MEKKLIYILFGFLISITYSKVGFDDEERKNLMNKLTKKIELSYLNNSSKIFELKKEIEKSIYTTHSGIITYQPEKIKKIIDKYNFPQNYNFIDEEKPDVYIKDQGNCGSCWALATTTALSYRFHKQGIKVNLSPQNLLSCYIRDCSAGDYSIFIFRKINKIILILV